MSLVTWQSFDAGDDAFPGLFLVGIPRHVVGGIVVYPAEQNLEVLGLDVEPHVLEEVPELRQAEGSLAVRVVPVEDSLGVVRWSPYKCTAFGSSGG